jgi:hypothetical protein
MPSLWYNKTGMAARRIFQSNEAGRIPPGQREVLIAKFGRNRPGQKKTGAGLQITIIERQCLEAPDPNLRDSLHKHFVYDVFYPRYFFLIKLPKRFDDSLFIYRADLIKHNPAGFFV